MPARARKSQPATPKGPAAIRARLMDLSADVLALHRAGDAEPERLALQQVGLSLSAAIQPLAAFGGAAHDPRFIICVDGPDVQTDETVWFAFERSDDVRFLRSLTFWDSDVAGFERASYPTPTGDVLFLPSRNPVTGGSRRCLIFQAAP